MLTQFFDIKMRPSGYALCQAKKKVLTDIFYPKEFTTKFLTQNKISNLLAQILQYAMSCANNDELIVYL